MLRRSIFSNLIIYLKKNQDRGYPDLSLFEIGPTFSGNKPGEQQVVLGALKSGVANRKSWESKARNIDAQQQTTRKLVTSRFISNRRS